MEPIQVPGPPPEAFNKNRPVSDLIRAQVNHFKHLEYKLSDEQRQGIPQHGITTESDAAQYIAAMTGLMLSQPAAAQAVPQTTTGIRLVSARRAAPAEPAEGIAIAASADTETTSNTPIEAAPDPAPKKNGPRTKSNPGTGAKGRGPSPKGKK